jgi:hypothetical protein
MATEGKAKPEWAIRLRWWLGSKNGARKLAINGPFLMVVVLFVAGVVTQRRYAWIQTGWWMFTQGWRNGGIVPTERQMLCVFLFLSFFITTSWSALVLLFTAAEMQKKARQAPDLARLEERLAENRALRLAQQEARELRVAAGLVEREGAATAAGDGGANGVSSSQAEPKARHPRRL